MATAVKAVLLRHMKSMGEKAKQYAGGHVAALAQAVADAMEEMDTAKADKPEYIDIIIPATGWQTDSTVTGYTHYLDIPGRRPDGGRQSGCPCSPGQQGRGRCGTLYDYGEPGRGFATAGGQRAVGCDHCTI